MSGDYEFMTERELDSELRFAQAHVQRALTEQHVEYYAAVVMTILNERRLREIIRERGNENNR